MSIIPENEPKQIYIAKIKINNINKMSNNLNRNQNLNPEYVHCRASGKTKLLKTPIDRRNIAKELSKYFT